MGYAADPQTPDPRHQTPDPDPNLGPKRDLDLRVLLGAFWGPLSGLGSTWGGPWGDLGTALGDLWDHVGDLGGHVGDLGGHVGAMSGVLGAILGGIGGHLGGLGGMLGVLGAILGAFGVRLADLLVKFLWSRGSKWTALDIQQN